MELQVQTVKLVLVLHFETLFGHVWAILDKFSELQVFAHRFPSLRMLRFDRHWPHSHIVSHTMDLCEDVASNTSGTA
jgi:hypothetical protein